jgi:type IV secretory pathway VirB10-like protein
MEQPIDPNSAPPVAPAPVPENPPPAPAPEPPRAAAVVNEGKSQAEIDLEEKLSKADQTIKDHARVIREREQQLGELQDLNSQLKRAHMPAPKPKKKSAGWTFFHGEA